MNLLEELKEKLKEHDYDLNDVVAIDLYREYWCDNDLTRKKYTLRMSKSYNDKFHAIVSLLNFDYDNGFGAQEIFGIIWLSDGTWIERREYDGSEWFEHCLSPVIPSYLH